MSEFDGRVRRISEAVARVAAAGLLVGVIGGVLGLRTGGTSSEMATSAARAAWILVPALPITWIWSILPGAEGLAIVRRRATDGRSCVLVIAVGTFAALLGSGVFLVPATNIPVLFSDAGAVEFRSALTRHFGWYDALLNAGITCAVSTVVAGWAYRRRPT